MTEVKPEAVCPDGLTPDGAVCPRCGGARAPSGIGGGTWVHFPSPAPPEAKEANRVCPACSKSWDRAYLLGCTHPFHEKEPLRLGPHREAKEAEEELPKWIFFGHGIDEKEVLWDDFLMAIPKLSVEQQRTMRDALARCKLCDKAMTERDAANALARSVQNNCDNLARELAEMTKRAEDSQTACTEAFNDAVGQEAKRIDLTKQLAEMTKRAETAEEERRDTLIDAGVHAIWDGRERAVARVVEIAVERDALTARLATVTAERDELVKKLDGVAELFEASCRDYNRANAVVEAARNLFVDDEGAAKLEAALRALDAAPPEEAKRCLDGHLSETAHLCGHPKCPVHGASSVGQCACSKPSGEGTFMVHDSCPIHGVDLLGRRWQKQELEFAVTNITYDGRKILEPDPTPHPAVAMATNDARRKENASLLDRASKEAPLQLAKETVHRIAVSCASFIAAIDADSSRVAAYLEQRLQPLAFMSTIDMRSRDALQRIATDGRQLVAPQDAAPAGKDTGLSTDTGHCARCGMFADELPHSEAFAHRHDFVAMADAKQLRAALVAAHARIAALESEAADVARKETPDSALRQAVRAEAKSLQDSADCLRREIARGVAVRQSFESKGARAQVLESVASTLWRLLNRPEPVVVSNEAEQAIVFECPDCGYGFKYEPLVTAKEPK